MRIRNKDPRSCWIWKPIWIRIHNTTAYLAPVTSQDQSGYSIKGTVSPDFWPPFFAQKTERGNKFAIFSILSSHDACLPLKLAKPRLTGIFHWKTFFTSLPSKTPPPGIFTTMVKIVLLQPVSSIHTPCRYPNEQGWACFYKKSQEITFVCFFVPTHFAEKVPKQFILSSCTSWSYGLPAQYYGENCPN